MSCMPNGCEALGTGLSPCDPEKATGWGGGKETGGGGGKVWED